MTAELRFSERVLSKSPKATIGTTKSCNLERKCAAAHKESNGPLQGDAQKSRRATSVPRFRSKQSLRKKILAIFLPDHSFALNALGRRSSLARQRGVERKPEALPFLLHCRRTTPLPLKIPDSGMAARIHSIEAEKPGILCRAFQDRSC